MPVSAKTTIDNGGNYVTVVPQTEYEVHLLNRQLKRIQAIVPEQKHRITPTKLAKQLVLEKAQEDAKC
ncbi:hypothetical protein [Pseudocitrobacter cyperus]|uniref:Uncharacterized protein n=1 Tax=Pseudocitrobacter cyperus TaxID=3112843 RepID=A0ABV0HDN6_9ENTR